MILIAVAVSIDAYFAGLSYGIQKRVARSDIALAGLVVFAMCYLGGLAGGALKNGLRELCGTALPIALVYLGLKNMINAFGEADGFLGFKGKISPLLLGVTVGTDAMLSCFILALPAFAAAALVSVLHVLFMRLGAILGKNYFSGSEFFLGAVMIVLALLRLVT